MTPHYRTVTFIVVLGLILITWRPLPLQAQAQCIITVPARLQSAYTVSGTVINLKAPLAVEKNESIEIIASADNPCTLEGNEFSIYSTNLDGNFNPPWYGSLTLRYLTIKNLGNSVGGSEVKIAALSMNQQGGGAITIANNLFDHSNRIRLQTVGSTAVSIRHNTVLANSTVPISSQAESSQPAFELSGSYQDYANGNPQSQKLFQGNKIYRSYVDLRNPYNWLVGGDTDADSNIFIGLRAGIQAFGGSKLSIKGNYVETQYIWNDQYPTWSQVPAMLVSQVGEAVTEQNVIRRGQWNIRALSGIFRDNLSMDMPSHYHIAFMGSNTKVYRNLFIEGDSAIQNGVINAYTNVTGIEIYNNTFVGSGGANLTAVPIITISSDAFIDSIRNNIFYNFAWNPSNPNVLPDSQAIIQSEPRDSPNIGYADYNLFANPLWPRVDNYKIAVANKTERVDAGFAKNDRSPSGPVNEQVDPKFAETLIKFPFAEADIKAGQVTVSQILTRFRDAYTPQVGSPLIDAGDPQDGEGTDIGAVDAGLPAQSDTRAKLLMTKQVDQSTARTGDLLTYTLTIRNTSQRPAINIKVSDVLSKLGSYIDGSASDNGQLNNGAMIWRLDSLPAGQTKNLTFKLKVL